MSEKITGYTLLGVGLLVIFLSVFSVYQVFTKKASAIQLFSFPGVSIDLGKVIASQMPTNDPMPAAPLMQEVIPANVLNESANIAAHLFLMGFIGSAGYKVASLGVQMLRPIHVTVKEPKVIN